MATERVKGIIQDNRHIETKRAIKGAKLGQEIEVVIHFEEGIKKNKTFSFSDHDFGNWQAGRMRREDIYHENGR